MKWIQQKLNLEGKQTTGTNFQA